MNVKRLIKLSAIGIASLAVCALVLPALASLDNPVTRPVKVWGNMTVVFNPMTGLGQCTDWGESTAGGRYSNAGWCALNAEGKFVAGEGVVVVANGDTIEWVIGSAPNNVVYTGGTGRFEGVTGGFVATATSQEVFDNGDGTWTSKVTYVGIGKITY